MITSSDYLTMFESCALTTNPTKLIELSYICKIAMTNEAIYTEVESATGIPWPVIAAIHYRESDQSFKYHLHNGDPLTARTTHVPKDRPHQGEPPFTWQESAIDALTDFWHPFQWNVAGMLEFCERYNGLGYQKHCVNSPYVWACTDQYSSGLFITDGQLDMLRKDPRPGAAAIFKTMLSSGVALDFTQSIVPGTIVH